MGQMLLFALRMAVGEPEPATRPALLEFAISRPIVLVGIRNGTPTGGVGNVGVLIPLLKPAVESRNVGPYAATSPSRLARSSAKARVGQEPNSFSGLLIEADAGPNATRVAVGWGRRLKEPGHPAFFGQDIAFSTVRTKDGPRGATPNSTYLGVDASVTLVMVRVGIGVGHRVSGATGDKGTIFTWSIGAQVGF